MCYIKCQKILEFTRIQKNHIWGQFEDTNVEIAVTRFARL